MNGIVNTMGLIENIAKIYEYINQEKKDYYINKYVIYQNRRKGCRAFTFANRHTIELLNCKNSFGINSNYLS